MKEEVPHLIWTWSGTDISVEGENTPVEQMKPTKFTHTHTYTCKTKHESITEVNDTPKKRCGKTKGMMMASCNACLASARPTTSLSLMSLCWRMVSSIVSCRERFSFSLQSSFSGSSPTAKCGLKSHWVHFCWPNICGQLEQQLLQQLRSERFAHGTERRCRWR